MKEVKNMRNLNRLLTFALIVGLVLTTAYFISAQQEDTRRQRPGQQGQRQGRRQFDPEAMMKRMVDRTMEQLKLSEEESAILKPKIEGILQTRTQQSTEMRTLMRDLRTAVDAKDDAQIKAKLDAVKTKRKEHKAQSEKLEKELIELLTVTQEAQLTISGIVNSDGSGFFGGFGGRDRGGMRGGEGARGARGGMRRNQ
jgi:uncharacterized membrane protein YccC